MRLRHNRTLLTGKPAVGKTTLLQTIVARMSSVHMAGFYTTEIRTRGSRSGFELHGLDGTCRTLAHVDINSRHKVGKYGVDTDGFEAFLEDLDLLDPGIELIVIDEIGRMELFSNRFRSLIRDVMNADKQVLATIALKGQGFIREIKQRPDIQLIEVTRDNRDRLLDEIIEVK
ncbi:MAG: nucleoside-triphosphatase [Desulfobacterales bacterium]|nr:nucleoside-triphosphatase [Desulfobacterales bacterium]